MDIDAFWANPPRYTAVHAGVCPSTGSDALNAEANRLASSWTTTGFYTWQEMSAVLVALIKLSSSASSAAGKAGADCRDCGPLQTARDAYYRVLKPSVDYNETILKARTAGAMIDSPGFKPWVIAVLRSGANLMREVEIVSCTKPFWLDALRSYVGLAQTVADIAIGIGKAVVAVGQALVSAGDGLYAAWPYIKWGLLGFGVLFAGVFTWNKLHATAARARQPFDWSQIRTKAKSLFPTKFASKESR